MTLLIVDANRSRSAQLKERMTDFDGSEVVCFSDARDALAWSIDRSPHCVMFTDDLAGMDALEFFRMFRHQQRNATIPAIMVGVDLAIDVRRRALALGVTEILSGPLDYAEFSLRVSNLVSLRAYATEQTITADWLAGQVSRATSLIREREREIIVRLSHLAEYSDPESTRHIARMAHYCEAIARGTGLGKDLEDTMLVAAPMHDIGKIAVPDYLIQRRTKLSLAEVEFMKQHTTIGYEILSGSSSPLVQAAAEIALSHHERYDGSGYPRGLAGSAIPLTGRVCALADAFDAMTTERAYKPALSATAALSVIERCSAYQFDPALVGVFKAQFRSIADVQQRFASDQ